MVMCAPLGSDSLCCEGQELGCNRTVSTFYYKGHQERVPECGERVSFQEDGLVSDDRMRKRSKYD